MRSAIRVTAGALGMLAGFSGILHGYYEVLQGKVRPGSVMISSYGPPCEAAQVWHACEPAMTVIPDFFLTGIAAMAVGLVVMIWAAAFVQRKHGGAVLILLSVVQLLVGGGLVPPLIGITAGVVGTRINTPLSWWRAHLAGKTPGFLASVWPWSLAGFLAGLLGLYPIGYFFNGFLLNSGHLVLLLIFGLLLLSIPAAFAHDIHSGGRRTGAQDGRDASLV